MVCYRGNILRTPTWITGDLRRVAGVLEIIIGVGFASESCN